MKSPITNKPMELMRKPIELTFRKEAFRVSYHYFLCTDSKEEFTNTALDEINQTQVYNQYREKYGVPFPEEILAIREKYNVSASRMSELLGLGANTYRLYESGEMPSVANGRLILSNKEPQAFINQVEASSHFLTKKDQEKLIATAKRIQEKELEHCWDILFEEKIFNNHKPGEYNGYKTPNLDKVAMVISYFSRNSIELYKTKLNKLLFYADFLMYNKTGYSITGITYKAIPYGPVPSEYDKMYIKLCDDGKIVINLIPINDNNFAELIKPRDLVEDNLSTIEIKALSAVVDRFGSLNTKNIVDISHEERAWKDNEQHRSLISYQQYAFELQAIK